MYLTFHQLFIFSLFNRNISSQRQATKPDTSWQAAAAARALDTQGTPECFLTLPGNPGLSFLWEMASLTRSPQGYNITFASWDPLSFPE